MSKPGPIVQMKAHRERLTPSVVDFFENLATGKPIAERDEVGRIKGWVHPTFEQRLDGMKAILGKLMPSLQASQVDVTSGGDGVIQLILGNIVAPGGGQAIEHQNTPNKGAPSRPEIENHQERLLNPGPVLDLAPIPADRAVVDETGGGSSLSPSPVETELPPEAPPHARMRTRRRSTT